MSSHEVRAATHAGSWYTSSANKLQVELSSNLAKVNAIPELDYYPPVKDAKAIIAPHAGYTYSGGAAAWAYAAIPVDRIKRIVLLGPSHHAYIPGVALSKFKSYGTPLGDIPLDLDAIESLRKSQIFQDMKPSVDEDEHSLEMHLPYIRHVFAGRDDLKLIPILVGNLSGSTATRFSEVLEPYWHDAATFFIVSSDFCHWGSRFSCTPYYPKAPPPPSPVPPVEQHEHPASFEPPELVRRFSAAVANKDFPIWKSIEYMDHLGMDLLRRPAGYRAVERWEGYLEATKNTICGRNPITALLRLIQHVYNPEDTDDDDDGNESKPKFTFVRYEQSSKCMHGGDSSVSYVSGVLRLPQ